MSGASIQREVDAALREVARDVGDGQFLVKLIEPAPLPVYPWDTQTGTPTEYDVPAMVSDYPQAMIDETLIQQGDKRIMLSSIEVVPKVNWLVQVAGVSYAIMMVREYKPSGIALYTEVQARA